MRDKLFTGEVSQSEGDVIDSPLRERWLQEHLGAETRELLEEDMRYFPH